MNNACEYCSKKLPDDGFDHDVIRFCDDCIEEKEKIDYEMD